MVKLGRPLWLIVCFVTLVSAACTSSSVDQGKSAAPPAPSATVQPWPTPTAALPVPTATSLAAVFCPDTSSSYPRPLLHQATSALADQIDRMLKPGGSGATIYVRTIKENSYSWDAELMPPISVPALPGDPVPPALPPEPAPVSQNPFARKAEEKKYQEERAIWESEVRRLQEEFQAKRSAQEAGIAQARERLTKQTDQLRQIDPPVASGSDIWGCAQKGSELLDRSAGAKYLVIASDLDEYGPQEKATLSLKGVRVRLVFFYCDEAQKCEQRRSFWTKALGDAGAAGTRFYNPEEAIRDVFD